MDRGSRIGAPYPVHIPESKTAWPSGWPTGWTAPSFEAWGLSPVLGLRDGNVGQQKAPGTWLPARVLQVGTPWSCSSEEEPSFPQEWASGGLFMARVEFAQLVPTSSGRRYLVEEGFSGTPGEDPTSAHQPYMSRLVGASALWARGVEWGQVVISEFSSTQGCTRLACLG